MMSKVNGTLNSNNWFLLVRLSLLYGDAKYILSCDIVLLLAIYRYVFASIVIPFICRVFLYMYFLPGAPLILRWRYWLVNICLCPIYFCYIKHVWGLPCENFKHFLYTVYICKLAWKFNLSLLRDLDLIIQLPCKVLSMMYMQFSKIYYTNTSTSLWKYHKSKGNLTSVEVTDSL